VPVKPKKIDGHENPNDLLPYINNAKTHSAEQIKMVAASIKEFGFNNPVLIDGTKNIIAGHCRVLAAMKLGLEEVPVRILNHLSPAQKKAYILADNKLSEVGADWNMELVNIELEDMSDYLQSLTGFDSPDLDDVGGDQIGLGEIDEVFQIIISSETAEEQEELLERFLEEGLECRALTL